MATATDEVLSDLVTTFKEGMRLIQQSRGNYMTASPLTPLCVHRERDEQEGIRLLRNAANRGLIAAQHNLATLLLKPVSIKCNPTEAEFWFRKAAQQGFADSQYNLGVMLFNGYGIPKNEREGVEWFIKATKNKDIGAMKKLSKIVDQDGIIKNFYISDACKFVIAHIKYDLLAVHSLLEYINKLYELSVTDKQTIIFYIVVFYKNDKKKMREIIEILKKKCPSILEPEHREFLSWGNDYALHNYIRYINNEEFDKEIIDILIEIENTVNKIDSRSETPLATAIKNGNEKAFNALIAVGANIYNSDMIENSEKADHAPLHTLLNCFFKKALSKEKVLRMLQTLIKLGSNPNISDKNMITAAMRAIGAPSTHMIQDSFDVDIAKIFLSSPKFDFACKSRIQKLPASLVMQTVLDYVTSEDMKVTVEAQRLVKDSLKDRFQKYCKLLADLEPEILNIIHSFPSVIGKIVVEYTMASVDIEFIEYGSTENSLTFLYGLTEDRKFRDKVDERCAKLLTAPKT